MGIRFVSLALVAALATAASAEPQASCAGLPTVDQLRAELANAAAGMGIADALGPGSHAGGLFQGEREWAAVVNRKGELCAETTSKTDPNEVWPGSEAIAKAKAYTANAFSIDGAPMSTARLYTLAQPGHSLFGIASPTVVVFGGGLPVYKDGKIAGGIGVSGDTACADHEIAKRLRNLLHLDPPGGPTTDDVIYAVADGPSLFAHPLCGGTIRNGADIGSEKP